MSFTVKVRDNGKWIRVGEFTDLDEALSEYNELAGVTPRAIFGRHPVTGKGGRMHAQYTDDSNEPFIYRPRM